MAFSAFDLFLYFSVSGSEMGGTVASWKIVLFFLAIIRVSHSHSAENFNDVRHYDRSHDLQAIHLTTPISKLSEDDLYGLRGANILDGLDARYNTNDHQNVNADESHSWSSKAKRRWAENSMAVWGKRVNGGQVTRSSPHLRRMWSENSMAVWGKRIKPHPTETSSAQTYQKQQNDVIGYDFNVNRPAQTAEENSDLFNHQPAQKRRWAENSMSVWGKRISSKNVIDDHLGKADNSALQTATRELPGSSYPISSLPDQERLLQKILHRKHWEPKRNWATNTMNVWGKRENREDKESKTEGYVDEISSYRSSGV